MFQKRFLASDSFNLNLHFSPDVFSIGRADKIIRQALLNMYKTPGFKEKFTDLVKAIQEKPPFRVVGKIRIPADNIFLGGGNGTVVRCGHPFPRRENPGPV
jgi:hypothetical protein